jgi:hypothetical protein
MSGSSATYCHERLDYKFLPKGVATPPPIGSKIAGVYGCNGMGTVIPVIIDRLPGARQGKGYA